MKIDGSRKNEIRDFVKTVKSLSLKKKKSDLLKKVFSRKIENEAKEQKGRFLNMLLGTSAASLLGKILSGNKLFELVKKRLKLVRIFHAISSIN